MNVILILLILSIGFGCTEEHESIINDLVKRMLTLEARVGQNDCCQNITEIVEK